MIFDGIRQPNTLYVASVSRGKDSTAMLRAIQLMGWPLDMIASVDIWFDDDTPAELPPMVAFKDAWDRKCLDLFGIPVTRLCATKRERESRNQTENVTHETLTEITSTESVTKENSLERLSDSQCSEVRGVTSSKPKKLTYCDVFYRKVSPERERERERELRHGRNDNGCFQVYGFPLRFGNWCQDLKRSALTVSQVWRSLGVQGNSRGQRYQRLPLEERRLVSGQAQREYPRQRDSGIRNEAMSLLPIEPQRFSARPEAPFSETPANDGQKINIIHYVGIAADEPERIKRHIVKKDKVLPLVQIGWDEALCGLEATYMDMLSPTYSDGQLRDGCWFCHNQGVEQLRRLRKNYPNLWQKLLALDNDSPVTFKADGHTVHDFDKRFQWEDDGFLQTGKQFRWSDIEEPQMNFWQMEGI